jgi:hypothetical protein
MAFAQTSQELPRNTVDCDPHVVNGKEVPHCEIEDDDLHQGSVELMPTYDDDAGIFSLAVKVAEGAHASRAVVTIHYKQQVEIGGHPQELWRTQTSVVEVVPNVFVGADTLRVTHDKIQRIEVVLVKDIEEHCFAIAAECRP